ncbi:MgtC/SapB family protein [Sabulicella glaciei]|uniref:Protein MgtC n=1 Tax=Sabulicella glaciei TaxID=2984948 RepID=A0ABT3P095_9PROT|nr:MgtC/SapB family protein [Roseococcus sp. MDT2-1-1]MCW8087840.1 MgtC/SapB family protein [Roseococcus sp. MDT2-1-1]
MEISAFNPVHLSWVETLVRIGAALFLSLALGVERFVHKKPIDFRPFVIIALGACVLMMGIVELAYRTDDPQLSVDPAKVVSGILTGIGFIAAGALFREKHVVHGAGSAASILGAGAIGITCGMGFLWLGGLFSLSVVLVLILSRPFTDEYAARAATEESDKDR